MTDYTETYTNPAATRDAIREYGARLLLPAFPSLAEAQHAWDAIAARGIVETRYGSAGFARGLALVIPLEEARKLV